MNPDESPAAPGDTPRATLIDGLITCPHCSGWIESSSDHAGQVVACPHCGGHLQLHESIELGFVPPPVHRERSTPREPWFYRFIDTYAKAWMWFSLLAGTLGFLGAAGATFASATVALRNDRAWILAFVIIATIVVFVFWLLGILLSVAFMHLAVDIGRILRAIHHHSTDRER
jgi:hypothetical protein